MQEREVWDLFDEKGQFVRTFVRGNGRIPPGFYHKTVEVIPTDMCGHLLLTRRSMRKKTGAGQWEFPAGSVISGETEEEAALRELKEETGLEAKKVYRLQIARYPGIIRYIFLAYIPNMTQQKIFYSPEEIMDHQFCDYDQWLRLCTSGDYNSFRSRFYTDKLYTTVKQMTNAKAILDKKQQHKTTKKPLARSSALASKKNSANTNDHVENEDTPELPEWEPDYEQGDDGA